MIWTSGGISGFRKEDPDLSSQIRISIPQSVLMLNNLDYMQVCSEPLSEFTSTVRSNTKLVKNWPEIDSLHSVSIRTHSDPTDSTSIGTHSQLSNSGPSIRRLHRVSCNPLSPKVARSPACSATRKRRGPTYTADSDPCCLHGPHLASPIWPAAKISLQRYNVQRAWTKGSRYGAQRTRTSRGAGAGYWRICLHGQRA